MAKVLIAGGGPAGLSAALWAHRLGLHAEVVERESHLGGQLRAYSLPVVDLPGFGPDTSESLLHHLQHQVTRFGMSIHLGTSLTDWSGITHVATLSNGSHCLVDRVFYAPGLRSRLLDVPGSELVSDLSVTDFVNDNHRPQSILMIGAGDRAVEGAVRLCEAGHRVTLICRSPGLRARMSYQKRILATPIDVHYSEVVSRIQREGTVLQVELTGMWGASRWEGDAVLVRIGMEPNVNSALAVVQGDIAYPKELGLTVIGDAALNPWERSLVTVFASGMRAMKRLSLQMGDEG